jgi:hypothetical protein
MTKTPLRPIVYRFVLGKGLVKRRQESSNTARAVVEQVAITFADDAWEEAKKHLQSAILNDVRAELVRTAANFRRHVIGVPGTQRGTAGTLTTVTKGDNPPRMNLRGVASWGTRSSRYLAAKRKRTGSEAWFDNTGWAERKGGTFADFFRSKTANLGGGNEVQVGSGGAFEDLFGAVSVQVVRNSAGWGVNQGSITANGKAHVQLASIRVRALGGLSDRALQISGGTNYALLEAVKASGHQDIAMRLRGGRGRYRPTMEPYLKFFLQQALPYAVAQRIRRATADGRLFVKR